MNQSLKHLGTVATFLKAKRKTIFSVIVILVFVAAIVTAVITVQRARGYEQLKKENDELRTTLQDFDSMQEQLAHAEKQVELYKESTNALTQQVSDLNAVKEDLNNQLEELLNVNDNVPVITKSQLEYQLDSISELVSQKYMYRNATKKEGDKTWLWGWTMPFSDTSLLATYDGTIKAGIDLKDIAIEVNEAKRIITITIPDSKILDHNIPQETINVLEVKNNLFNKISFNDYNKFISAEKIDMEQIAIERGLLDEADKETKEIIETFLSAMPGIDTYTLKFN